MKFLLVLFVGLFISLSASGGVVGNINSSGKEIGFGSGLPTGHFNRADFTYELAAKTLGLAGTTTSFRFASGTPYQILTAPSKSILIGISCSCNAISDADGRVELVAGDSLKTNTLPSGLDVSFWGDNIVVIHQNSAATVSVTGNCHASRSLNVDLTAAFSPLRPFISIRNEGIQGIVCIAYVKEE